MKMIKRKTWCLIALSFFIWGCASNGGMASNSAHETALDFSLPDQNGNTVMLSQVLENYNGAVIAFYPKDDSKN
jgi:hypothetical protein